ncbi:MAG: hypothetical protein E7183_02730 [Erysipelotrichaceae bacterium]|nr:hypothetical protein [Erysipelotrichaceae bacterium]
MNELKKLIKEIDGCHWNNILRICDLAMKRFYCIEFLKFNFTYKIGCLDLIYMHFSIPVNNLPKYEVSNKVFLEDYVLRQLTYELRSLNDEIYGSNNSQKETHGMIKYQECDDRVLSRNSIFLDEDKNELNYYIKVKLPLVNNKISAKSVLQYITKITLVVRNVIKNIDVLDYEEKKNIYDNQLLIRKYLKENNYVSFIANNSILPRFNGTEEKDINAIPFQSPETFEIEIPLSNGESIYGMGIKKGITSIIGGAFSGKSTLLNAIENGIYNHIKGDGREYCITDDTAIKVSAEDGRYISNLNISSFFTKALVPDIENFTTLAASGSISQAANIVEAINGKSKLILIEEDSSATNFLIKDEIMRDIINADASIPFTDRIKELEKIGLSVILVTGATSKFLEYSNQIIKFEKYICHDVNNEELKTKNKKDEKVDYYVPIWESSRRINIENNTVKFILFKKFNVVTNHLVFIDDFEVNIKNLESIKNNYQINSLCFSAIHQLGNEYYMNKELINNCYEIISKFNKKEWYEIALSNFYKYEYFLEEVRPIDAYRFINRIRGIKFEKNKN